MAEDWLTESNGIHGSRRDVIPKYDSTYERKKPGSSLSYKVSSNLLFHLPKGCGYIINCSFQAWLTDLCYVQIFQKKGKKAGKWNCGLEFPWMVHWWCTLVSKFWCVAPIRFQLLVFLKLRVHNFHSLNYLHWETVNTFAGKKIFFYHNCYRR